MFGEDGSLRLSESKDRPVGMVPCQEKLRERSSWRWENLGCKNFYLRKVFHVILIIKFPYYLGHHKSQLDNNCIMFLHCLLFGTRRLLFQTKILMIFVIISWHLTYQNLFKACRTRAHFWIAGMSCSDPHRGQELWVSLILIPVGVKSLESV